MHAQTVTAPPALLRLFSFCCSPLAAGVPAAHHPGAPLVRAPGVWQQRAAGQQGVVCGVVEQQAAGGGSLTNPAALSHMPSASSVCCHRCASCPPSGAPLVLSGWCQTCTRKHSRCLHAVCFACAGVPAAHHSSAPLVRAAGVMPAQHHSSNLPHHLTCCLLRAVCVFRCASCPPF
jgi:hypothetical protein